MTMHWCSLKTDCTIKFCIPKLYENTTFHNFNVTHDGRKNYKVTITFMENDGNTLIKSENMKIDEHVLVLIKKQIAPLNAPYQNCVKTLHFIILMSLMMVKIIIKQLKLLRKIKETH